MEAENMKLKNKGQGAMEYLMTYGWAILVVMIVGVVLWQLGVFGGVGLPEKVTEEKCMEACKTLYPSTTNVSYGTLQCNCYCDTSLCMTPNNSNLTFCRTWELLGALHINQ